MRRSIGWAALLLCPSLVLLSAGPAGAQDKKDKEEKGEQLVKVTAFVARIASISESERKIGFTIRAPKLQWNGRQYSVTYADQNVDFKARDDVLVRTARPREAFDDKGKIKKFTKAELKELKGDPKLPGYKAEYGDLASGQIVEVTLVRKKGAMVVRPKVTAKRKKDMDELEAADALADNMPQISRIVILAEPMQAR